MKKLFTFTIAIVLSLGCVFGLTACGGKAGNKIKTIGIDLTTEQYGIAVKQGDTQLLASVNAFLKDKKGDIDGIMGKYLAEGVDLNAFGSDKIKTTSTDKANELVVATNLDFAPFEYKVGKKIAGIDMEVAQLLADYLGKTLVVVHMDFEAVVTSVSTGAEYDIGFAGLTINEERKKLVNFSDPYIDATQTIIVSENSTLFADCADRAAVEAKMATLSGNQAKCGGQTATTSMFYIEGSAEFEYAGFENLTYNKYGSAAEAVQDMLIGRIAFVVVDKATAQALVSSFNN